MGICINHNNKRKNQVDIFQSNLIELDINIVNVSPSICKIKCLNQHGTGFFIKLKNWNEEDSYFLMTNEHVITRENVESKENIEILYDYESQRIKIKLNKGKRFIKDYIDIDIDIIIIQILKGDNINKKYFLSPYIGEVSSLEGKGIYIL